MNSIPYISISTTLKATAVGVQAVVQSTLDNLWNQSVQFLL